MFRTYRRAFLLRTVIPIFVISLIRSMASNEAEHRSGNVVLTARQNADMAVSALESSSATNSIDEKAVSGAREEKTSISDESEDDQVLSDARELVSHVIYIDDDPTPSPWTIRAFVIGLG